MADEHKWRRSIGEIRLYRRENPDALIIPGHDPEDWAQLDAALRVAGLPESVRRPTISRSRAAPISRAGGLGVLGLGDHDRRLAQRADHAGARAARPAAPRSARPRSATAGRTAPARARTSTAISRHAFGPSTEGASSRMIRCTAGSRQASRNASHPARCCSHGSWCGERGLRGLARHLLLDLLGDRAEQVLLAAEVVVERAAGHARAAHDLLRADVGVAALREQLARRRRPAPCASPRTAPPACLCEPGHSCC